VVSTNLKFNLKLNLIQLFSNFDKFFGQQLIEYRLLEEKSPLLAKEGVGGRL